MNMWVKESRREGPVQAFRESTLSWDRPHRLEPLRHEEGPAARAQAPDSELG
jgi:hypothetical protein